MSALPALFLLVDGAMKLAKPELVVKATVELGYPESVIFGLGMVLLTCIVLYLIPQTAVLGAILLTGYLGGAVATQVRVGAGLFPISFPIVLGVLLGEGLSFGITGCGNSFHWCDSLQSGSSATGGLDNAAARALGDQWLRRTKRSTWPRRQHGFSGFNVTPAAAAGELGR